MLLIFWLVLSPRFSPMFYFWSASAISFVSFGGLYILLSVSRGYAQHLCSRDHGGGELIFYFSHVLRLEFCSLYTLGDILGLGWERWMMSYDYWYNMDWDLRW